MRLKPLPACLILLLLCGCLPPSKDWTHPRIADPRKEDKQFLEDSKFCQDKIGPQGSGKAGDAAMDDCFRRLGWQRKE